jgi:16S rRNA (cytidine1402-2'-O)-methyltransferase
LPVAIVIYEAPHRVRATVADLAAAFGADRTLVVSRELTKAFETITRIALGDADAWFAGDPNRERGEFVLIVDVRAPAPKVAGDEVLSADAERWLAALLEELPPAHAARVVATVAGIKRDVVYARALALKARS